MAMPRLLQLLKDNLNAAPRGIRVENAASSEEAQIYVYDVIGFWGIEAGPFVKDLAAITAPAIRLHINSPGGDVFDARAMATAIAGHPAKVIASIDSLAASAATFLACAADEVEIADGAFYMIHNAWCLTMGNAVEHDGNAALLRQIDGSIVDGYAKQTGLPAADIEAMMAAETWLSSADAVEKGFADRKIATKAAENRWNLGAFARVPDALTRKPAAYDRALAERRLAVYERATG